MWQVIAQPGDDIVEDRHDLDFRRITLSNKPLVGHTVGELFLPAVVVPGIIFMLMFSQLVLFSDPAHGLTKAPALATASSTPYAPSDAWVRRFTSSAYDSPGATRGHHYCGKSAK